MYPCVFHTTPHLGSSPDPSVTPPGLRTSARTCCVLARCECGGHGAWRRCASDFRLSARPGRGTGRATARVAGARALRETQSEVFLYSIRYVSAAPARTPHTSPGGGRYGRVAHRTASGLYAPTHRSSLTCAISPLGSGAFAAKRPTRRTCRSRATGSIVGTTVSRSSHNHRSARWLRGTRAPPRASSKLSQAHRTHAARRSVCTPSWHPRSSCGSWLGAAAAASSCGACRSRGRGALEARA